MNAAPRPAAALQATAAGTSMAAADARARAFAFGITAYPTIVRGSEHDTAAIGATF